MKIIKTTLILLLLAACGGGGGGSDGGGGGNRNANDPSCNINGNSATDSPTCTPEFLADYGLDLVNAEAVYDAGGTGQGRVVAVLDTGIDSNHEAFAGRIHPNSKNFNPIFPASPPGADTTRPYPEYRELDAPGYQSGFESPDYIDHYCEKNCGHGTTVASVIAANKDGIAMQGVAYNAQILVLKSDFIDPDGNAIPTARGMPAAVEHAIANNVDAINLSAGGREYSDYDKGISSRPITVENIEGERKYVTQVLNDDEAVSLGIGAGAISLAVARATQNDVAIVFATGNESGRGLTPQQRKDQMIDEEFASTGYPATLAGARTTDCDDPDKASRLGGFCEASVRKKLEAMDGYNAAEGPFNGLILGVAAVDADRNVWTHSSLCDTMDPRYCLAAPGVNIRVAFPGGGYEIELEQTDKDGKMIGTQTLDRIDGTSFAAPYVAGAIALLRSAHPNISSKQAVRIILQTADDVIPCAAHVSAFDCFNDDYGNGILNLRRALGPLGDLGFRTQAGEPAGGEERTGDSEPSQGFLSISSATLSLPMAFGDALGRESLGRIIAYDDYQRGYVINLAPRVNRQGFKASLDSILSFDSFEQETGQTSLSLGRFNLTTQFSTNLNEEDTEQVNLSSLHFSANLGGANIGFATGGSSRPTTLSFYGEALRLLGITHLSPSPYAHLVQNGAGFTIDSHLKDWAISYGLRQGDGASGAGGSNDALAFDIKAERSFDSGIYLGGLVLVIAEQNSFLAASGRGVFDGSSGTTQSLTLGMGYAQGNTRIFGQVSGGQTKISLANGGAGAILSDFSAIKTSAALIGMSQQKVFATTDRFDIVLSRPLKVSSASATLNADSSGTDISGQSGLIASGTSRVSLAPSGQQTNLELTYTNAFSKTTKLSLGLALINQPAHNAAAKNERALALRWVKHF